MGKAKKKFDEVKKKSGRIPETTRSGNPLKCNSATHQTKPASTNLG